MESANEETIEAKPAKVKLRWHQFTLRSLLLFVLLVAVFFSWVAVRRERASRQNDAWKKLTAVGLPASTWSTDDKKESWYSAVTRYLFAEEDYSHLTVFRFNLLHASFYENQNPLISDADLQLLKVFPQIKEISLRRCKKITDSGLAALSDLPNLETLDLSETNISGEGFEYLQGLKNLRELKLSGTKISDESIKKLNRLHIRILKLSQAELSDSGCELLRCDNFPQLDFSGAKISETGFRKLRWAHNIFKLNLSSTKVSDACFEEFPSRLCELNLSNTKITDNTFQKAQCYCLDDVDLSNTAITDATLAFFRQNDNVFMSPFLSSDDTPALRGTFSKLSLANTKITDAGLENLKTLSHLQELSLAGTSITDAGLAKLKEISSLCSGLRYLDLSGTGITDEGLQNLPNLSTYSTFILEDTNITDKGLVYVKRFSDIEKLNLAGTKITDAGLIHLQGMKSLSCLDLSRTKVTDAGLTLLRSFTGGGGELLLSATNITDAGLANFQANTLSSLCTMDLSHTGISDAGIAALGSGNNSFLAGGRLRKLNLSHTAITDKSLKCIKASCGFLELNLSHTNISDIGLKYLNRIDLICCKLDLSGTNISDEGLEYLQKIKGLVSLKLRNTKVTEKGIKKLEEALPCCQIEGKTTDEAENEQ